MADEAVPMVGIVVVNYFGGELTMRCLESLEQLTWPAERLAVALVDNGSEPGYLDEVRRRFPRTRIVETGSNLGFGAACNRGVDVLDDCEYIALLNNDAIPEPGWLEPLVTELRSDPGLGAATPKVLLAPRYVELELRSPAAHPGVGDSRRLGVQLCGVKVDGVDASDGIVLVSGFWGWEVDATTVGGAFSWTDGLGRFLVPVPGPLDGATSSGEVDVRLAAATGNRSALIHAGDASVAVDLEEAPTWHRAPPARAVAIINNVGVDVAADGSASDRGYLEVDRGQFDEGTDVFAWSGAAVCLAKGYLDDVGGFDERLFLYYEDVDLAWRGRKRGWRYRSVPSSVVWHQHSASVGDRSELAVHLSRRNRLVVLSKNAPPRQAASAIAASAGGVLTTAWRDIGLRAVRGRRPVLVHVTEQARPLLAAIRLVCPAGRQAGRGPRAA